MSGLNQTMICKGILLEWHGKTRLVMINQCAELLIPMKKHPKDAYFEETVGYSLYPDSKFFEEKAKELDGKVSQTVYEGEGILEYVKGVLDIDADAEKKLREIRKIVSK